jgi:hypothetical protein
MEMEREEVDRECYWALVSAIVLRIRDHRLTCYTPADRVEVVSLDYSAGQQKSTNFIKCLFSLEKQNKHTL